ncbi:hypothetical protein AB6A40_001379 [Gnathostoma spinigerum]|uniref:DNA primase large subunit n=1 Tax=Gnathostoma spinigerum TaxID=75299 RepID=A0ABD6EEC2_9BILA
MQFVTPPRTTRRSLISGSRSIKKEDDDRTSRIKQLNLQLYLDPPTENISIFEFEELAVTRLKVLRIVEQARERFPKNREALNDTLSNELVKLMPIACGSCAVDSLSKERRRDIISHFILRLAFCKTQEETKWFLQQELALFRFRFAMESKVPGNIAHFLKAHNFNIEIVSDIDKASMLRDLLNATALPIPKLRASSFWKVPFTDALELVRRRKVLLRHGFAYVVEDDLVDVLCARLRTNISGAMARACKYIGFIEEEHRLLPLLNKLTSRAYIGKNYDGKEHSKQLTRDMIDSLAVESFPLCMRRIHDCLRREHHIRHNARLQYGLFLKGIGLSLEEALAFFRAEFTRKIDSDKFDKQYAYNIRYNYGKEGKRVDFPAYPCNKIILGHAPAQQDCHGCPYRHMDPVVLSQKLEALALNPEQRNTVLALAKSCQYDRACTRYFEFMHNMEQGSLGTLITHPNQYFELSRQIREGHRTRESAAGHDVVITLHSQDDNSTTMETDNADECMD